MSAVVFNLSRRLNLKNKYWEYLKKNSDNFIIDQIQSNILFLKKKSFNKMSNQHRFVAYFMAKTTEFSSKFYPY